MTEFNYLTADREYNTFFLQLPKPFITSPKYRELSSNAKIAYTLLRDRSEYSMQNNLVDEKNRIYFLFTDEDLAYDLSVSRNTARKAKQELINANLLKKMDMGYNKKEHKRNASRHYLAELEVSTSDVYPIHANNEKNLKNAQNVDLSHGAIFEHSDTMHDENFDVIYSSLYEISEVLGLKRSGRTYNQLTNTLRNLRQKEVIIYNEETETATVTGWLKEFDVSRTGQVEAEISLKLAPYLLALKTKGHYTQHVLKDTIQLDSKYSIRLYKLMREADKHRCKVTPVISHTPDKLSKLMSAPESYNWSQLKQNIVDKAIDEINLKIDDMDLELHTKKEVGKLLKLIFTMFFTRLNKQI